jgi:hypothetical protein
MFGDKRVRTLFLCLLVGTMMLGGCATGLLAPAHETVILVKPDGTVDPSQEEVPLSVNGTTGRQAARWVALCLKCKLRVVSTYRKWPGVDCDGEQCVTKKLRSEHVGKQKYQLCVTPLGSGETCGPDPWITINP